MSPNAAVHDVRLQPTLKAALLLALLSMLSGCLAPGSKTPQAAPPEIPYESMAASIALGRPQDALRSYEKAVSISPHSRATQILHARLLLIAGKLAEARVELDLVIAAEPRNADALYNLSLIEGLEGHARQREALLRRTVQVDGAYPDALADLGRISLEARDPAAAQELFDRALARDPSNLAALVGIGSLLLQSKQWNAAEKMLGRAIETQPDYPFSYIDRARARQALSDYAGAVQDLTRAISLDPRYPWSYIDRGRLFLTQSLGAEARADFSMAIQLDPDQFEAYALRAQVLAAAGDEAGALQDWEHVLRLKPDYGYVYVPLATLAWSKGDWPRARETFLLAYRFQEDEPSLALCAALCAIRQGRPSEVAAVLAPALSRIPDDSWYHEVARFLLDRATEGTLLARIDRERDAALKARMLFYVAIAYLSSGMDRAGTIYLMQADGTGAPRKIETELVHIELARSRSTTGG
jgi:tetratricopeptide (TPR) repeat protein